MWLYLELGWVNNCNPRTLTLADLITPSQMVVKRASIHTSRQLRFFDWYSPLTLLDLARKDTFVKVKRGSVDHRAVRWPLALGQTTDFNRNHFYNDAHRNGAHSILHASAASSQAV